jgi:hypothetical protein
LRQQSITISTAHARNLAKTAEPMSEGDSLPDDSPNPTAG